MKLVVSKRAQDEYNALSPNLQKRVDKQFSLLLADLRYPSLRAKKYEGMHAVWQGRIDRFYFHIGVDAYVILTIVKHPRNKIPKGYRHYNS